MAIAGHDDRLPWGGLDHDSLLLGRPARGEREAEAGENQ